MQRAMGAGVERELELAVVGDHDPGAVGGHRPQALRGHRPPRGHHRQLTAAARDDLAGDADLIAPVDGRRPQVHRLGAEDVAGEHDLEVDAVLADDGEAQPAVVAHADDAPHDRHQLAGLGVGAEAGVVLAHRIERGGARHGDRVRRDPVGSQRLELAVAHQRLAACRAGDGGPRRRGGVDRPHRGGELVGRSLAMRSRRWSGQEALSHRRGDRRTVEPERGLEAHEAGIPARPVLHVGAVQRLELPPPRGERQHGRREPQHRAGADLLATAEHAAQHGEIQRQASHAEAARCADHPGDHELDDAVVGGRVPAHQVEGEAAASPWHERQQRPHFARRVQGGGHHAAHVGGVAEAAEGHREPALGLVTAPALGELGQGGHLVGGDLAMAAHDEVVAGAPHA